MLSPKNQILNVWTYALSVWTYILSVRIYTLRIWIYILGIWTYTLGVRAGGGAGGRTAASQDPVWESLI